MKGYIFIQGLPPCAAGPCLLTVHVVMTIMTINGTLKAYMKKKRSTTRMMFLMMHCFTQHKGC